ncbi:MAG: tRNA epoxyqueuosine(34) reductase QueG [Chloroflexota bacterium]
MDIGQALKDKAGELGFSFIGIVPAVPSKRLSAYLNWIDSQYHGKMGYLARPDRLDRRQDLTVILPKVKSLICVGLDYATQPLPSELANDPSRGRISSYAWGVDYHDIMTPRLKELGRWLESQFGDESVRNRVYVDTGAILERDHAESAGLGFTGKNTMLIRPRSGSFFFLGELLTTAVLPYDVPKTMPNCGRCTRCLTACPTNAFPKPYVLDARRCISYLTIELKDWIPLELRPLIGNWIYGCDICQIVCPFNRFAQPTNEAAFFAKDWSFAAPSLLSLLQLDDDSFRTQYKNSPIYRVKRARFVRNACVAAGNWGSKTAVPYLIPLLKDSSPIVRGHAAWALGQIGERSGLTAVYENARKETEPEVIAEFAQLLI